MNKIWEDWRTSLLMQPLYILAIPFYGVAMMMGVTTGQIQDRKVARIKKMLREKYGDDFWETLAPTKRSRGGRW